MSPAEAPMTSILLNANSKIQILKPIVHLKSILCTLFHPKISRTSFL
jgi:hypothetical protein